MMPRPFLPLLLVVIAIGAASSSSLRAFCGFYVAKADTRLFNKASQVVLVRDGDRTVLTMSNDFKGDPKEFALVVPVPTFLERDQIHVGDRAPIDHLDAFSAPRLVEYYDEDPCRRMMFQSSAAAPGGVVGGMVGGMPDAARRGVTIEARYTIGEYEILILSAKESTGLEQWLRENGYRIPPGASEVLGSYIRQNMRFFVAKVDLKEQARLGFAYLRPLQIAYESPKFMLPIRLGTVNADGPQELFVFALTRKGRIETTNYRTVKLPTDMDVPLFVKDKFPDFYRAMFAAQVKKENMSTVFLEYAWDTGWCDPCAADPLSAAELRTLGVFWLDAWPEGGAAGPGGAPVQPWARPRPRPQSDAPFVTRLHVRYDRDHFPEDLVFQETADRGNFQGRYVMRHAWKGSAECSAADDYRRDLGRRREQEAQALASLTGWDISDIRRQMSLAPPKPQRWWEGMWR